MRLSYRLVNVFARAGDRFSGNPLCVFEDGAGLTDEQMLALGRQFNLSETTFLVPPAPGADVGVRIFTTAYEMPFAGHPTLGSAHVARELHGLGDTLGLSMPAGTIPVVADGDHWTLTANPGVVQDELDPAALAAALGLDPADVVGPVQQVSVGTAQVVAPLASVDAVRRARVHPDRFGGYAAMGRTGGEALVYAWAPAGDGRVEARALISDGAAVAEDPATGSACSNLGASFAAQGLHGSWLVSQGSQVARPSQLHLDVSPEGVVRVGGLVSAFGAGTVDL